ncbi:amino acid ABC transporter permease [Microbacterium sp. W4I20]|uniref:amino acid ABC transporter permease n=1 Tax=Microbacterium sp. W4I20 TaxID=3042262 RepID=UPI00278161BB|nr:amino acid ABC transporter permease [Microbacterium sp. W4I20]MDQ0729043.1 ABC-type amino acid transport system permease subunit [Microbacterium sp. W4I20]
MRWPVTVVTEFMRAVPVLVMMFLLYYGLPVLGVEIESYWAVVIALVAYNGSVLAEVIRAGVESLPRGQSEAGYSIGLRKAGVMQLVLLPQAIRAMMPVIISQLVVTLKDTALGFIITYEELLLLAKQLGAANTIGRPIVQMTMVVAVIYIGMCLLLSLVARMAEKRMSRSPKVQGAARHLDVNPRTHDGGTDTELIAQQRL